jgi:hypothetical protein
MNLHLAGRIPARHTFSNLPPGTSENSGVLFQMEDRRSLEIADDRASVVLAEP